MITWTKDRVSGLYLMSTSASFPNVGQTFFPTPPLFNSSSDKHALIRRINLVGNAGAAIAIANLGIFITTGNPPASSISLITAALIAQYTNNLIRVDKPSDGTQSAYSTGITQVIAEDVIVPSKMTIFGAYLSTAGSPTPGSLNLLAELVMEDDC